jgi:hypothetical protein
LNTILLKHKPVDVDREEFAKVWSNAGYSLQALYGALHELKTQLQVVKADDFDCPNHYAKLAYQAGMVKAYENVLALLPETAKK